MQNRRLLNLEQRCLLFIYVFIGTVTRILPHPANVTAMTSISFLAGREFSKVQALLVILLSLLISDISLAYLHHYPIFGSWSLFTYTGFSAIALLSGPLKRAHAIFIPCSIISASVLYWYWSNLGTWLFSCLYSKTLSGFTTCYIAALPFLRNALIGDLFWMAILLSILKLPRLAAQLFPRMIKLSY